MIYTAIFVNIYIIYKYVSLVSKMIRKAKPTFLTVMKIYNENHKFKYSLMKFHKIL